jgi:primase-polymerase (primpol)-like protein
MIDAITTATFPVLAENIPEDLRRRPQWVTWRLEERNEKLTKVPFTPGTARRASSTDLTSWRPFEKALAAYEAQEPPCDGIGFVFCSGDPYVGIDVDDCRDPESGEITDEKAREILDRLRGGYVEVSPSGAGLHIIVEGTVRGGGMRKGSVEMYARDRFFTITGRML